MSPLKGKRIVIISPQAWGTMKVSKHHFAVELAKYGNEVYFINPPSNEVNDRVKISNYDNIPDLFIVQHRLIIPYNLKFHAIRIFHFFMKMQVAVILRKIGKPVDIIWSFDLGNIYPFRFFPTKSLKIFHPVDEPLNETAINSAKNAHIIFSVTKEILEKYRGYGIPSVIINHGVSEIFLQQNTFTKESNVIRIGFSGNLLRKDIDRPVLIEIITRNPEMQFEFWGSMDLKSANIGGDVDRDTVSFLETLKQLPNVSLHGPVSAEELANAYRFIDAFLICYDIEKDQSKGTNYHKIMEFLSTGKLIVSNNVSAYANMPDLIQMTKERSTNKGLPILFKSCIERIKELNEEALVAMRIEYARGNSYKRQVERIEAELLKLQFPG